MKKKKSFISDHHAPFADIDGTKMNYLFGGKSGQWFSIKRGNFEWELRISESGKIAKVCKAAFEKGREAR